MKAAPIQATATPDGTQLTFAVPDGGDSSNGIMAPGGLNRITITTPGGSVSTFRIPSDSRIVARVPMNAHSASRIVKTAYGTACNQRHALHGRDDLSPDPPIGRLGGVMWRRAGSSVGVVVGRCSGVESGSGGVIGASAEALWWFLGGGGVAPGWAGGIGCVVWRGLAAAVSPGRGARGCG